MTVILRVLIDNLHKGRNKMSSLKNLLQIGVSKHTDGKLSGRKSGRAEKASRITSFLLVLCNFLFFRL